MSDIYCIFANELGLMLRRGRVEDPNIIMMGYGQTYL